MKVVERKPVPIYETTCPECKSRIEYKASEVGFTGYITCPVCGISVWASAIKPVRYEDGCNGEIDEQLNIDPQNITIINEIDEQPTTQPEIVKCKDCQWGREVCGNIECSAAEPTEYHSYEWFCPNGKRRTNG